jgi:hypothetical protein
VAANVAESGASAGVPERRLDDPMRTSVDLSKNPLASQMPMRAKRGREPGRHGDGPLSPPWESPRSLAIPLPNGDLACCEIYIAPLKGDDFALA